ncbi:MAG: xanthine dehydrogenase accessory factor [Desulforhopalus sp.]|jgi:xanthine dehydrogenase accessory factor
MEKKVVDTLAKSVTAGESVALVSVTDNSGSSPAKCGAIMLVNNFGAVCGTVGGGSLELKVIGKAQECIRLGRSLAVDYSLTEDGGLGMSCGGNVHFFIKVFSAQPRLIIVGGGHVGMELYQLGLLQGYRVEIFDDREGIATADRFPAAALVVCGDPVAELTGYQMDCNCFVTIATHSHELDKMVLAAVAESEAGYVGMIGSSRKIKKTLAYLLETGISRETIGKLYAPMGLNVATIQPKEIAVSIMSEILLVKNDGTPEHMKTVKKITF